MQLCVPFKPSPLPACTSTCGFLERRGCGACMEGCTGVDWCVQGDWLRGLVWRACLESVHECVPMCSSFGNALPFPFQSWRYDFPHAIAWLLLHMLHSCPLARRAWCACTVSPLAPCACKVAAPQGLSSLGSRSSLCIASAASPSNSHT